MFAEVGYSYENSNNEYISMVVGSEADIDWDKVTYEYAPILACGAIMVMGIAFAGYSGGTSVVCSAAICLFIITMMPNENNICLFTGIICTPYSIIILLKFINRKKKDYTLIFNKEFKKIGNLEFIEKTYTFEKRNLKYEAVYGTDITNLEFSFDNYYKVWLEEENNVIAIQFNKKPNASVLIIYYDNIQSFKQYCVDNNIKYKIVKRKLRHQ